MKDHVVRAQSKSCMKYKKKFRRIRSQPYEVPRPQTANPEYFRPDINRKEITDHVYAQQLSISFSAIDTLVINWARIKQLCRDPQFNARMCEEFFKDLQATPYPLFERRTSNIKGAGMGVFVTRWYPWAPSGSILWFHGALVTDTASPCDYIYINKTWKLQLTSYEEPPLHLANFVNNQLSPVLNRAEVEARLWPLVVRQNYQMTNCRIIGRMHEESRTHTYRLETVLRVPTGMELLTAYGTHYAGHRVCASADLPDPDLSREDAERSIHPRWPHMSSRT